MKFTKKSFSNKQLLNIYHNLLTPRLVEEKMLLLLRKGALSKWFSGIGQEAISVGATLAVREEEYILPVHRNLGVFTARNMPLEKLFAQFQGKKEGYTNGRDRSFHFGSKEHHVIGMISHLASQLSVADGIALAGKLSGENKVVVAFTGDGGTSEGEFHEALNVAAVWNLPVIFIVENNGYSISTPTSEQFRFKSFTDKGKAYGIQAQKINGNNVLEVYETVHKAARNMRRHPKPILIEAETFRMRGHEESSRTDYVPEELFIQWEKEDPIVNFENFLLKENILDQERIETYKKTIKESIDEAWIKCDRYPFPTANAKQEESDIYSSEESTVILPDINKSTEKRFVDALNEGLNQSLERHSDLILMGQDIADYGGVFKVTQGLAELFGKERVRNTPLCESAIVGIGMGLAIENKRTVIEMQFADFVSCAFNQIVNNLAKSYYRWGQRANVVVRMPTGAGNSSGPFHSQSNEAWFFNTPGLKILYPSNPYDAKGLLNAAIEDQNPVIFFEHKGLYRSQKANVPDEFYTAKIGKGKVVQSGEEISVITYGMGIIWATEFTEKNTEIDIEIIDLRSLQPWDKEIIRTSVMKTGKAIILTEDTLTGAVSGEIASWISDELFEYLDAPVKRVGSLDTPVPFHKNLEENFLPPQRFSHMINQLSEY